MSELLAAGEQVYESLLNLCVWAKDNGGMGSFYRSQHELIFVFRNGKTLHRNNVQLGRFGRNRTNVWNYPGANTMSRNGEEGNVLAMHPTVKPVALIADALLDSSARGEIVLDPFLGAGTTLLAAERVGCICRGIEIDPPYVDLAIRRWQQITGEQAIHATTKKKIIDRWMRRSPVFDKKEEYKVGYGKPPKATQFTKGQSGNPKGRPRGSRNLASIFQEVANEKIRITENGRSREVSKSYAAQLQLVNKAASGDLKAMREFLALARFCDQTIEEDSPDTPDREKDAAVVRSLLQRMKEAQ